MLDHYQRVLVAIPLVLALGAAVSLHSAVAIHEGLAAGSLVAMVFLYEVLFRNPPVERTRRGVAAMAAVGAGAVLLIVLLL